MFFFAYYNFASLGSLHIPTVSLSEKIRMMVKKKSQFNHYLQRIYQYVI